MLEQDSSKYDKKTIIESYYASENCTFRNPLHRSDLMSKYANMSRIIFLPKQSRKNILHNFSLLKVFRTHSFLIK